MLKNPNMTLWPYRPPLPWSHWYWTLLRAHVAITDEPIVTLLTQPLSGCQKTIWQDIASAITYLWYGYFGFSDEEFKCKWKGLINVWVGLETFFNPLFPAYKWSQWKKNFFANIFIALPWIHIQYITCQYCCLFCYEVH